MLLFGRCFFQTSCTICLILFKAKFRPRKQLPQPFPRIGTRIQFQTVCVLKCKITHFPICPVFPPSFPPLGFPCVSAQVKSLSGSHMVLLLSSDSRASDSISPRREHYHMLTPSKKPMMCWARQCWGHGGSAGCSPTLLPSPPPQPGPMQCGRREALETQLLL